MVLRDQYGFIGIEFYLKIDYDELFPLKNEVPIFNGISIFPAWNKSEPLWHT